MTVVGWPGVRRAAEWGKKKYAGSWLKTCGAGWTRWMSSTRGMLFAATLLLCFVPFLIVVSALGGWSAAETLTRYTGLNSQAATDVGHLFASPEATASAVVGTTSMVFFVLNGIAAATALQEIHEQAFDLPHRGMKYIPRRLAWLAVLIGTSLLTGWAGPGLRHAGGPALLAAAGLVWATGFWWLTMRILLAGRVSVAEAIPGRLRHGRAVCGHGGVLFAVLLRHGDIRRQQVRADRDHLRPAVLPDRHRRRGHPGRGRGSGLARALIW